MQYQKVIILGLVVAQVVAGSMVYNLSDETELLSSQIEALKAEAAARNDVLTATTDDMQSAQTEIDTLQKTVVELGTLPTSEMIATAMYSQSSPNILGTLAAAIKQDSEFKEAVRGAPGQPGLSPSPNEVANYIQAAQLKTLSSEVAKSIWRNRKADILSNEAIIANIAEKVYQTYGNAMKGDDGKDSSALSAPEIVRLLSTNAVFARLVADFRKP